MFDRCQTEVVELHRFFQDWFAGQLPNTEDGFARFADVMEASFEIITPAGHLCGREELLKRLRSAHGCDPDARIWTLNFEARQVGPGLWQARYEEWQSADDGPRGRRSSALLRNNPELPGGVEWLHLHEVWMPKRPV